MSDIYERVDIYRLLGNKSVLFMGDSIMRNIYKDLVYFITERNPKGQLTRRRHLCAKGEDSFMGDTLVDYPDEVRFRNYVETRDYHLQSKDIQLSFYFITRCYSDTVHEFFANYKQKFGSYPDVIMVNSALWDINRWGPSGIKSFNENIVSLMEMFTRILEDYTQVIWMTTPPISTEIRGGFQLKDLKFQQLSMRFNIMEGNARAAFVTAQHGFDVIDMHHHFANEIHRRAQDGVHWNPDAVRMQTNIFLTHVALSRG